MVYVIICICSEILSFEKLPNKKVSGELLLIPSEGKFYHTSYLLLKIILNILDLSEVQTLQINWRYVSCILQFTEDVDLAVI